MTSATHYNVVQEQKMMLLTNPFTAQLNPKVSNSLAGKGILTKDIQCNGFKEN